MCKSYIGPRAQDSRSETGTYTTVLICPNDGDSVKGDHDIMSLVIPQHPTSNAKARKPTIVGPQKPPTEETRAVGMSTQRRQN